MNQVDVFAKFVGDIEKISESVGCKAEKLNENIAILKITPEKIKDLKNHNQIQQTEICSKISRSFSENSSDLNSVCANNLNNFDRNLTGKGVIIAILDSGIDFRHPDFIDDNGNSRILYIWDQNQPGNPPDGFDFGTEYSNSEINMAINNEIEISEMDLDSHGTAVAGISAGNGRLSNKRNVGIAPESSLIIVKLLSTNDSFATSTSNISRAVKYVFEKSKQLQMPIVINISYGTNQGTHDGQNIFEQYLDSVSDNKDVSIVVASGNEGLARHHFQSYIKTGETLNIEFSIKSSFENFTLTFVSSFYDSLEFQILNSSGEKSPIIDLSQTGEQNIFFGRVRVSFILEQPTPIYEGQKTIIVFSATGDYIPVSSWTLKVIAKNVIDGRIDAWLPITEESGLETQFLNPEPKTTLTIPSTAFKVISVGGYDSHIDEFAEFSGRGYTRDNLVKPDLVAPSVSVISTKANGTYSTFTGTSFAAPFVSGACAIMMQWGIINQNDSSMYGQRLKAFLKIGTNKKRNIKYPNNSWGYGTLCINSSLNYARKYSTIQNSEDISAKKYSLLQNSEDISAKSYSLLQNSEDISAKNYSLLQNSEDISAKSYSLLQNSEDISAKKYSLLQNSEDISAKKYSPLQNLEEKQEINPVTDDNYMDFVMKYDSPSLSFIEKEPKIKISSILQNKYAIIHVPSETFEYYRTTKKDYVLAEKAMICGLSQDSALNAAGITAVQNQQFLQLRGNGVLVGIIDTGIDFNNECFRYENGNSKISYLWDQESNENPHPDGFLYGSEYDNTQINNLISENYKASDLDEIGHGTFISSVISGRKSENSNFVGAAPDANIIFVKLKKSKQIMKESSAVYSNSPSYESTDIMSGVEYILKKANELEKPVVINIPLQSNEGAHDGLSYFEQYLSEVSSITGVGIVIPVGNQANKSGHLQVNVNQGDSYQVEFNVANKEKGFLINLWTSVPDRVSVSLTTPLGNKIERRKFTINEYREYDFVLEKTKIKIQYIYPDIKNGNQNITIKLIDPTPGLWTLNIFGDLVIYGVVDIWMPISQFLNQGTAFLNATVDGTATIPSTAVGVIAVGAYDHIDESIYLSSGRGQKSSGKIKPDFVAPGVEVFGIYPKNLEGKMTGTGVSSAIVAGASALLLEWGISKENDVKMNTNRIKSYLILGCSQNMNVEYPNDLWGYGKINLIETFRKIR